jgi:hypothetical protein
MQTRKDRILEVYNSLEIDRQKLQKKMELVKRLAAIDECAWDNKYDTMLDKIESSIRS